MRALMKVKIGALTYRVVRVKKIAGDPDARAQIDFHGAIIRVLDGMEKDVETESILHELVHSISPNMGEQAVHTFSSRFFQFLIENQHFTRRLIKPLK